MKVLIIGSGGLAKQTIHLIKSANNVEINFFDTAENAPSDLYGYPIIKEYESLKGQPFAFSVCIGNPKWRKHFFDELKSLGGIPINMIDPSVNFSDYTETIGEGNLILSNVIVEAEAKIGKGNLLNVGSSVFHEVQIDDFNEIMPGAKLLGNSKIGSLCRIGTNAVILPGVKICDNVVIGAGAVVTKSITEPGTYVGVPAKRR
jgi:sugar O-acyltransferase (sialic acid O-acetyltransferase NeuD family)